jgi:hypothetical protein
LWSRTESETVQTVGGMHHDTEQATGTT